MSVKVVFIPPSVTGIRGPAINAIVRRVIQAKGHDILICN
jgi:hypothetical protein